MAVLYRTICRDFFSDADVVELTHVARLLYLATWLEADREGRLPWDLRTLSVRYFPRDGIDLKDVADELIELGLVLPYLADERSLAWLPKFKQFQAFNNREAPSKLPQPPGRLVSRGDASARVTARDDTTGTRDHAHNEMECNVSRAATCAPSPSQVGDALFNKCTQSEFPSGINSSTGGGDEF